MSVPKKIRLEATNNDFFSLLLLPMFPSRTRTDVVINAFEFTFRNQAGCIRQTEFVIRACFTIVFEITQKMASALGLHDAKAY